MYITFDEIMDYKMKVNRLQAENVRLKNGFGHGVLVELEQVDELKEQIKELKVENIKLSSECWCGGNNDVKAELNALREQELDLIRDKDELKAEINELKEDRRENSKTINELMIDKNRLMNQVSSNRGSNSNTIQREIAEYMSHNDTCKGARLFLLPIDEFKDGEWKHGCLFWDDGME